MKLRSKRASALLSSSIHVRPRAVAQAAISSARNVEQRTPQVAGAEPARLRHAGERGDAAAAHQLPQQRLGLIVAMVREPQRIASRQEARGTRA